MISLKKKFWALFWTQFLGAFNDNLFKNALVILITFKAFSVSNIDSKQLVALCGGIFILPFLLFSATSGQLTDKYSKSRLIFYVKICEIMAMTLAAIGFLLDNIVLLMVTLFLMGLQSTFFGPAKYSALPELLERDELVTGNAYVEFGTFVAILLGTIVGGLLISISGSGEIYVSIAVIGVALLGIFCSLKIPRLSPSSPELKISYNIIEPTYKIVKLSMKNMDLFWGVWAISWFWFLGAIFLSILPPYCLNYLHGDRYFITFCLALFSIGVGAGALLCDKLSFKKLELGLVPIGTIGMSIFMFDLFLLGRPSFVLSRTIESIPVWEYLKHFDGIRLIFDLFWFSFFGGVYTVPLYTLLQDRSEIKTRSRIIAFNNIMNALFMVTSALLLFYLYSLGLNIPQIFLFFSIVNILVATFIYWQVPEYPKSFIKWILNFRS